MKALRTVSWGLLLAGLAIGTFSDRPPRRPPLYLAGYRVLAADFHLHPFPLSASTLAPWDLMWDSASQGLDAVAITGHNEVFSGLLARWVARHLGGPTVLAGEEIHGPHFHLIAAGIHSTISWRLSAADAIAEIHRQGGVAIAAHPTATAWPAYDARATQLLDAAEVWQPIAFSPPEAAAELRTFYARRPLAAIASSDWHGAGPPGICRTLVFVRQNTEAGILQAIRDRRTVVYGGTEFFGDAALVALVRSDARLTQPAQPSPWAPASRIPAVLGLLGLILASRRTAT